MCTGQITRPIPKPVHRLWEVHGRKSRKGKSTGNYRNRVKEVKIVLTRKKAYSIEKLYANCTTVGEESNPVEVQLEISLEFSDWCKFQDQPFFQELIQYLDNVKIQGQDIAPDKQKSLQENKGYG